MDKQLIVYKEPPSAPQTSTGTTDSHTTDFTTAMVVDDSGIAWLGEKIKLREFSSECAATGDCHEEDIMLVDEPIKRGRKRKIRKL
jgi:hypothetical protein